MERRSAAIDEFVAVYEYLARRVVTGKADADDVDVMRRIHLLVEHTGDVWGWVERRYPHLTETIHNNRYKGDGDDR